MVFQHRFHDPALARRQILELRLLLGCCFRHLKGREAMQILGSMSGRCEDVQI
jgi:hypothetical protein